MFASREQIVNLTNLCLLGRTDIIVARNDEMRPRHVVVKIVLSVVVVTESLP